MLQGTMSSFLANQGLQVPAALNGSEFEGLRMLVGVWGLGFRVV